MAETVIVLYLSHFWTEFAEFLYAEIFFPTWKAYHFSSRSQRLQGQRPQGHKGQRPRKFETNFLCTLFICESITPTFEAQFPQYHWTYGNCQLWCDLVSAGSEIWDAYPCCTAFFPGRRFSIDPVVCRSCKLFSPEGVGKVAGSCLCASFLLS